jgi:hypothetical protein
VSGIFSFTQLEKTQLIIDFVLIAKNIKFLKQSEYNCNKHVDIYLSANDLLPFIYCEVIDDPFIYNAIKKNTTL